MSAELHAWWTPTGWERAPAPAQYDAAESAAIDLDRALQETGYHLSAHFGDEFDYEIKVWRFPKSHLYVDIWDVEGMWASLFVSDEHADPFIVDRLPTLIQALAAVHISDELQKIRRALVAYVRHGQDPTTIDPHGEESLDDRRRFQERQEWRRRQAGKQAS